VIPPIILAVKPAPLYALTAALGASILAYGAAFVAAFVILDLPWLFPVLTFFLSAAAGVLYGVARLWQGYAGSSSIVLGGVVTGALANVFWLQPSPGMFGQRMAFYLVSVLAAASGAFLAMIVRQRAASRRSSRRA
jgi:hypothetical protein